MPERALSNVPDLYTEGSYLAFNPGWHVEDSAWKARQVATMLDRHRLTPDTVCDVGCGVGEVLRQLQGRLDPSATLVGYEVAPRAFELAHARESEHLRFVLGDLTTAPAEERYDLLLAMDVIEHVENPFAFLRALKPHAGRSIFHIPLDMTAQAIARNLIIETCREPFGHLHYFQKETALATLTDAGYEIVDWFYTPSSFARTPESPRARLIQMLRRTLFWTAPDLTQRLLGGWSLLVLAH